MHAITKNNRIAVIGGGISGIAVAVALRMKGFERVKVFEKDLNFGVRRQGYGLTILQGKKVLRELGVLEEAKKVNAPTKAHYFFNEKGSILGFYGTVFWDTDQAKSKRWSQKGLSMHIPRQHLRKILLNKYAQLCKGDQTLQWNHNLKEIQCNQTEIELTFTNGRRQKADCVLGCDGIYSQVRELTCRTDNPLKYLGVMVVLGICGSRHGLSQERVFQSSNGQGRFYSMPYDKNNQNQNSMWQFSIPATLQDAEKYQNSPYLAKQFMKEYCQHWHQPIPSLIQQTNSSKIMTLPAFDRQPSIPKTTNNRIFLLGDANHPMSPFKSQGANQALLDGYNLAQMMSGQGSYEEIANRFAQQTFNRTKGKVEQSRERVDRYHRVEYLKEQTYLYPKIDGRLIGLIRQSGIGSESGQNIEEAIKNIMQQNGYISFK